MNALEAIILGIVEGFTEFLPVSSTGHLILASSVLGIPDSVFLKTFEIAIQSGAILAVVVLYARTLLTDRDLLLRTIVAFVPAVVIGFLAYPFVKGQLIGNISVVLWALFLGGVAIILFEWWHERRVNAGVAQVTFLQAFLIGLAQTLAFVPGISRAGAVILAGLALGISRTSIVEFSFLLAIPTMFAATGLDLFGTSASFTGQEWLMLAIGFVVSFVVAVLSIRFLLHFIKTRTFVPFGIYRIALAILAFVIMFSWR